MGYSSQSMRNFYPDLVIGGVTSTWVVLSGGPRCDYSRAVRVEFLASSALGGSVNLKVHPKAAEAFRALASVFRAWGYEFRELIGGTVSCRKITGGTKTSLHAHGFAMDINPSKNKYRLSSKVIQWGIQTDMPPGMIRDVEAIRTKNGRPVFEWGGRWSNTKDPMHFQPSKCSPADLATGIDWTTVNGDPQEVIDEMVLKRDDKGPAVTKFQKAMLAWNSEALPNGGPDGSFGPETEEWVRKYQQAAGISQTGMIDGVTGSLLSAYFPTSDGDGYTKGEADEKFASKVHPHSASTSVEAATTVK